MSEIYHKYQQGEAIPASELNTKDGLRLYGDIIHFDWRNDKATKQATLEGDTIIQKVYPVEIPLTLEQQHLARVGEERTPVKALIIDTFDRDMEAMRLSEVRADLEALRPSGWGQEVPTPHVEGSGGWGQS